MFRNKKGQSTIEYVIILTAVVAGLIAGANAIRNRINEAVANDSAGAIDTATARLGSLDPDGQNNNNQGGQVQIPPLRRPLGR